MVVSYAQMCGEYDETIIFAISLRALELPVKHMAGLPSGRRRQRSRAVARPSKHLALASELEASAVLS